MKPSGIRIGMRVYPVTNRFFDRGKVLRHIGRRSVNALSRFGAFVRQRAKTSIRKRKRTSKPGMPPSSHLGLLRKFILFSYDRQTRSVVIGPARINMKNSAIVPHALEYGGPSIVMVGSRRLGNRRKRRVKVMARPFMRPAFAIEVTKLPATWRKANVA